MKGLRFGLLTKSPGLRLKKKDAGGSPPTPPVTNALIDDTDQAILDDNDVAIVDDSEA